jgi:serine/threonine protein kinase
LIFIERIFLQPENILLTDDMHIQLTDFGSSVIIDNNECNDLYLNDSYLFIYLFSSSFFPIG